MEGISEPKKKEYGQKNLDSASKTFSQRAKERRAQNKIDATKRGQKLKDFFTKKNPDSSGAQLAERKSLKAANKITTNIGKDTSKSKSGIPNKKVGSRVRGPRDSIKTKPAKTKSAAAATMAKQKTDTKSKPTSFADAFKQAKGSKTFEFKGKRYARVTADEVKKAGFASLKDYLNAPRKRQIAKK